MKKLSLEQKGLLKTIGQRVADLRRERGLSLIELSTLADIEGPNISRLEKGRTNPTILTLKKLADGLEVGLSDLLSEPAESSFHPAE